MDQKTCRILEIKKIINTVAITGVFYILLYQIIPLRKLCIAIWQYMIDWCIDTELESVRDFYFGVEVIFKITICVAILYSLAVYILKLINDKKLKNKKGDGRFEESIFRYLHEKTIPRCFLVTGQWGSGKTHDVNAFFDKYYKLSNKKVYRISCFGLNSRSELIEVLNNKIQQEDNSVYALIINLLQYIPVIGGAMNKILKKSYTYDSAKKGSIFIFDDFERITSKVITSSQTTKLYKQSPTVLKTATQGRNKIPEFIEIRDEIKSIGKAINELENFVDMNYARKDYDKYIAITGLINELIETYKMNVIILCNSDILGDRFVYDVLISKLNCLEYKKLVTSEAKTSFISNIIKNKILQDEEKGKCISDYLNAAKQKLEHNILDVTLKNLRLFGDLIEAFIDTAVLFDKKILSIDFLNSLMNSMLIIHMGYYKKSLNKIDFYITGANMELLIKLYGGPIDTSNLIRVNNNFEEIKWIPPEISGYWILNMSKPGNIGNVIEEWNNYSYVELDGKILNDVDSLLSVDECNIMHTLMYQKSFYPTDKKEWNSSKYINQALKGIDLSEIRNVQFVLDATSAAFGGYIYQDFYDVLFPILENGKAKGLVDGNNYVSRAYNEFLKTDKETHLCTTT